MSSSAVASAEHVALPGRPESVGESRRFLADRLLGQGLSEDLVDTAVLLVSEVVTNAVVHARSGVVVHLETSHAGGVLVQVFDASPLPLARREHDLDAVAGRGLTMIEVLAASYGTALVWGGKVVWFALGDTEDLPSPGRRGWSGPRGGATPTHAVDVRLQGLPIGLYATLQQHDEALVREYQLRLLAADEHQPAAVDRHGALHLPRDDLDAVARAVAGLAEAIRAAVRAAVRAAGPVSVDTLARLDVTLELTDDDVAACRLIPVVLGEAEALAVEGSFLASPALPEMLALRSWLCAQVIAQADGGLPTSWSADDNLLQAIAARPVHGDLDWVAATDRAVVVSDDANRIVAASGAATSLLGWDRDDLVGRRLTTIVPPQLREAHVTGFARHVHTGKARILGSVMPLVALCRDGSEVRVRLSVEQVRRGAHTWYVGWLD